MTDIIDRPSVVGAVLQLTSSVHPFYIENHMIASNNVTQTTSGSQLLRILFTYSLHWPLTEREKNSPGGAL